MRSRLIVVISMLVFSVLLCLTSMLYVYNVMDRADEMRLKIILLAEQKRYDEAEVELVDALTYITNVSPILEVLTPHEDLHELTNQLTDARVSLAIRDMDDFRKAVVLFRQNIEHIRAHEALSLSNIL